MTKLTRIVAVVVDTKKAILYKEDGTTVTIFQGDERLRPMLEYLVPEITNKGYGDVDLSTENSWKDFEEKSAVRFFRIAKEKLKSFFGAKKESTGPVAPQSIGSMATINKAAGNQAAVQEILKYATPVKAESFTEDKVAPQRPTVESNGHTPNDRTTNSSDEYYDKHPETIVAVTPTGKVIPGVERIKSQFKGAVKNGSTKGIEIFLERIGKVIVERSHTVEDLLRFMERGDLPIADDGSIIIYKKLFRHVDGIHFVDPHTRKVLQRVGSLVYMNESLVDKNRRNECSSGLHVARRGYVGTFSGDAIVLAKVRPEDVIAVPDYDANKMRVCGYHIIAELSPEQYKAINSNRPLSDAEGGAELLAQAIAGNHVGVVYKTHIRGHLGQNLEFEDMSAKAKPVKPKVKKAGTTAKQVNSLESDVITNHGDKPVDVKKVVAKTKDASVSLDKIEAPKPITQTEIVNDMWNKAIAGSKDEARKLMDFKKKAKKGWKVWGLPESAGETLTGIING